MDLPPEIGATLAAFAPLFSDRAWIQAQPLAVGALLATLGAETSQGTSVSGNRR